MSPAEFALQALVAVGHVTQAQVDACMTLPGAPAPGDAEAKAARWDYVCRHWARMDVKFNKDAGNTVKSFVLQVQTAGEGAAGSPRLDSVVDQAIAEEKQKAGAS